jgi:GGDEF domain-containing protein
LFGCLRSDERICIGVGGEEFAVLFPQTNRAAAVVRVERCVK